MLDIDIKQLLKKSGFAALYGAIADLAMTGVLDESTIMVALLVATARGTAIFFTEIANTLSETKNTASKGRVKKLRNQLTELL